MRPGFPRTGAVPFKMDSIAGFSGRGGASAQGGDFLTKRIEAREQLCVIRLQLNVAFVCDGGVPGFNIKRAVRFEIAAMYFVNVFEALAMDDFDQFFARERLAL